MIDVRENNLGAIRQRLGKAIAKSMILTVDQRQTLMDALRDVPFLLNQIESITPKSDEHGRITIENEMLKEEVSNLSKYINNLEEEVKELNYEKRVMAYSGA